jgi:hypothetical protein
MLSSYRSVNRNELCSPASSPRSSPDPDLTQKLLSRVRNEFTFTFTSQDDVNEAAPQDEEEETELVLFAAPASAAPQSQKIRLNSPGAGDAEPGFIVKRPRSYYFADEVSSEQEAEYRASAVDAETILSMSKEPWPGCALPWKVKKISAKGLTKCVLVGHGPSKTLVSVEETERKRTRKGKKARIALRKKIREREGRKAEEERLRKEKEEAEREKKTRRNREKKVKKKLRDKAKKAAGGEVGDVDMEDVEVHEQLEG